MLLTRKSNLKTKHEPYTISFKRITMDESGKLDTYDKLAYIVLDHFAYNKDACYPGHKRIAKIMKCSEDRVVKSLKHLDEYGLITINRRGLGMTNLYTINDFTEEIKQMFPIVDISTEHDYNGD